MNGSITEPAGASQRTELETVQFRQAKVGLKRLNPDENRWRALVGAAIVRAFALAGLTQKEVAGLTDRDPAQVARWLTGAERPQFDVLLAIERLRPSLVQALAELAGTSVEIETVVRIRGAR